VQPALSVQVTLTLTLGLALDRLRVGHNVALVQPALSVQVTLTLTLGLALDRLRVGHNVALVQPALSVQVTLTLTLGLALDRLRVGHNALYHTRARVVRRRRTSMEKPKIWPHSLSLPNPVSCSHKNWQRWLRRGPLHLCKSLSRSAEGFRFRACMTCTPKVFTQLVFFSVFWGFCNSLQPRPLDGF